MVVILIVVIIAALLVISYTLTAMDAGMAPLLG